MKKVLLILAAALLVLSAGCGKQATKDDPAVEQNSTLEAVTGKQEYEVTLLLEPEQSEAGEADTGEKASASSKKTGSDAASGQTEAAAKGEETTAGASEPNAPSDATTAPSNREATAAANGSQTTAPVGASQTTVPANGSTNGSSGDQTLPTVLDNGGGELQTSNSGQNRYELPAIPLN